MQNTENKFKHDGFWYFSDDRKDDLAVCNSCAGYENRQACKSAPACYVGGRQDNRNVIFVRSEWVELVRDKALISADEYTTEAIYDALLSGTLPVPTKGGE